MIPGSVLTISRYTREHAAQVRQQLLDVYAEVYAGQGDSDPFHSIPRFTQRLNGHSSNPGWSCVIGAVGEDVVGFAYGRPDTAADWNDVTDASEDIETFHKNTFGLCEIMVREPWRGTGIARTLHDELMRDRPEARASLLVDETHPRVRATYERWGYRGVGQLRPAEDAPQYDQMVLDLA